VAIDNTAYDVGNGKILYDNAPTVCCVAIGTTAQDVLLVKRKGPPQAGLWALPGGFQMKGETMAGAAVRELREETGLILNPDVLELLHTETDTYGHNVAFFGLTKGKAIPEGLVLELKAGDDAEAVMWSPYSNFSFDDEFWAFPLHKRWAWRAVDNIRT